MPVAELRVGFRPVRNSLVLAVGYRVDRLGSQEYLLRVGYPPYAILPGQKEVAPHPVALAIERPAAVAEGRPAARVDEHGATVGHVLAGARPVEHGANLVRLVAGERSSELGAALVRLGPAGERPTSLGGALVRLGPVGERPTSLGGLLVRLAAAGERPTVHGAAVGGFAAAGSRPTEQGGTVWPLPRLGGTEARAAAIAMLWTPVAARETVEPGLVLARLPLLIQLPKQALVVVPRPMPDKAPKGGHLVLPRWWADKAPKAAQVEFALGIERSLEWPALWVPGRPAGGELPGDLDAAPYLPRPDDNERPYDPAEDWDETEPIEGPYNPPADPVTDPETGEIISPPPQEHVEPPPNAIVDPVTGEPRYPTGRTDPATGDPEILPPEDPTGIPGWLVPPYGQDVQEGVLLEFLMRFWDVWQAYQVYYGHLTGREAIRHLVGELRRWVDENPDSPEHEAVWWDLLNCARAAAMRYCPTYLRREWRQERYAVVDYETDAFNAGHFREPGRWIVDGWTFRYHVEPTDWALAPEKDRAAVLLGCNLPHGGWVDFEYLVAAGNAMRLVAVPSGQVLWESQGTIEDPYGIPGPHAAVAVPPGTTALRWEFRWGARSRSETVDYGTDAFNGNTFMDPTRWVSSGAGWTFQRQNDPDEYTDDIALAPQGDGAVVALEVDLPDGGRVEFEYGVADGNYLELVAMPSGQVLWSSGGTGVDPYGVPGPTAAVELPPGTTRISWRFTGTAVPPSGLRSYIDVVTVYRYTLRPVTPPSGLAGILDVVTLWRYEVRDVLVGAYPETVCEPNRGNDAVRDAWECWRRRWEERHKGKALRRRWLVT